MARRGNYISSSLCGVFSIFVFLFQAIVYVLTLAQIFAHFSKGCFDLDTVARKLELLKLEKLGFFSS
jgi:hypothetical protein